MSNDSAVSQIRLLNAGVTGNCFTRAMRASSTQTLHFVVGLAVLVSLWWIGTELMALNPEKARFRDLAPWPALKALPALWADNTIPMAMWTSGYRLFGGLAIAIAIGIPVGILVGRSRWFLRLSNVPFQFLRMISPLSWEPIAVVVFSGWEEAIIFLIAIGAVWPVLFSTAAGLAKVDPNWFKVARNLGAKPWHMVTRIILPAITFDILTGIRLALGVAWIVIIPAEFLGVTSGFGYAIQDARESLEYSNLMALILVIGAVGYVLDTTLVILIKRFSWHQG
jgi:NitT/TauT family transport system permease protein